jgi:23S rRNA (pseudouridine1915-N3)-methyltransferase
MLIRIITVGARPKPETASLIGDFSKRLPKHIRVQWVFIKHGSGSPSTSTQQEAEQILRAIPKDARVILLDERGKQFSSPELAKHLFENPKDIAIVIGGAYGVSKRVQDSAELVWSLGKLVYPHQLVRIIVAEQLYRAHSIHVGHPYHHD